MRIRSNGAPLALALLLALIVSIGGLRGSDWPAHLFRVELFRSVGMTLWNGQWYGGHHTPAYCVLTLPLSWLVGPRLLRVVSCVAIAFLFLLQFASIFVRSAVRVAAWGSYLEFLDHRAPRALEESLAAHPPRDVGLAGVAAY